MSGSRIENSEELMVSTIDINKSHVQSMLLAHLETDGNMFSASLELYLRSTLQ